MDIACKQRLPQPHVAAAAMPPPVCMDRPLLMHPCTALCYITPRNEDPCECAHEIDIHIARCIDIQTDRQTDRQTNRYIDR